MVQLVLLVDDVVAQVFPLDKPELTIGRSSQCDICINDDSVSATHALIRVTPNELLAGYNDVVIYDLQSKNGVLVNDQHVERCHLNPNDVITIGWNRFKFLDPQSEGKDTTALIMRE